MNNAMRQRKKQAEEVGAKRVATKIMSKFIKVAVDGSLAANDVEKGLMQAYTTGKKRGREVAIQSVRLHENQKLTLMMKHSGVELRCISLPERRCMHEGL